jgi:hypothetical protein
MPATDPLPLPDGVTAAPILLPVDSYAQLCVRAQRAQLEPADYLGRLMVAAIDAASAAGVTP